MEFLDSLNIEATTCRKSDRMRSWYLYEQYKSLEKNQIDAAQKLKEKSFQEKLLHQELSERKARRTLNDQFGVCQSEPRLQRQRSVRSADRNSHFTLSTSDFYESITDLQEEELHLPIEYEENTDDTSSIARSYTSKLYKDDFQSLDSWKQESFHNFHSKPGSKDINNTSYNLADDVKEKLKVDNRTIAENINLHLETVKENLQSLEKFSRMYNEDKMPDIEKVSLEKDFETLSNGDNNLLIFWTKLVSFAQQVLRLNHGNCYYDYSSQFLTAVLACDVLRKGVNKMCECLQPYVSPIKFSNSHKSVGSESMQNHKIYRKKCRKNCEVKRHHYGKRKRNRIFLDRKYCSDTNQSYLVVPSHLIREYSTEPWRSVADLSEDSTPGTKPPYPGLSSSNRITNIENPLLKLTRYLDVILKDIEDLKNL